jgi:hypothetical protein
LIQVCGLKSINIAPTLIDSSEGGHSFYFYSDWSIVGVYSEQINGAFAGLVFSSNNLEAFTQNFWMLNKPILQVLFSSIFDGAGIFCNELVFKNAQNFMESDG